MMDEPIDAREVQKCWEVGYYAETDHNPFDWEGDGNRAFAWEEGREAAIEKSRNFGYPAETAWGYAL